MELIGLRRNVRARVEARLDAAAREFLFEGRSDAIDFTEPAGEAALASPDSVSWRIFKNPVSLFIGGVTAVILEFAEPRVRTGVWEHTNFRADPARRLKRTGLAAMITVYGAQSLAEKMIAGVNRMHGKVAGVTPAGEPYAASDPALLTWVQATAAYGFLEAYAAYVAPITDAERERYYREGQRAAALYGAMDAPASLAEQRALFRAMRPRFERSEIVFEFLDIMRRAPAFPPPLRLLQGAFVRAAVDIAPPDVREILDLNKRYGLRPLEPWFVRRMARRAERIMLPSSPAVQACRRLGLPDDYLYRRS